MNLELIIYTDGDKWLSDSDFLTEIKREILNQNEYPELASEFNEMKNFKKAELAFLIEDDFVNFGYLCEDNEVYIIKNNSVIKSGAAKWYKKFNQN